MRRVLFLAILGFILGSRARSEREVVIMSFLLGLLYGGAELLTRALVIGSPTPARAALTLISGLVLALPVYAIAELWRRTWTRALKWLQSRRSQKTR